MSGTPASSSHVFSGYSTVNALKKRNTSLYDLDLINQDLAFAFGTRVGERVMRPEFGCAIWDYFMEQLTPVLREQIVTEAVRVCNTDSRVVVQNVDVFQQDNGLRVEITLLYQPYLVVDTFTATFEGRQTAYFDGTSS